MVQKVETKYGKILLDVDRNNTVVFLSGGLDSAVILYLVAKEIKRTRSRTNLIALTVRRKNPLNDTNLDRVDNIIPAKKVIDYVEQNTGVKVKEHHTFQAEYYWLTKEQNGKMVSSYTLGQEVLRELIQRKSDKFDESLIFYNAVTLNPPIGSVPESEESHRNNKVSYAFEDTVSVFTSNNNLDVIRNADKRITIDLARQEGILEDLLEFTRTCEGNIIDTLEYTVDCGKCWWCLEKQWALDNA